MKDDKKKNSSSDKVWCINAGCWMGMGVEIAETLRQRDYKDPSIVFVPVCKAEQSRAEQSRAEQSRAEQSRAERCGL